MRILYVIESISAMGGLERILVDKMNALSEDAEMEIALMTVWHDEDSTAYPLCEKVGRNCLEVTRPSSPWRMAAVMPHIVRRFNKEVKRLRPDIVVYFRAIGAMLASFSSWRGPSVFEAHGARNYNNHTWLYPLMERRVNAVVCLTKEDARNYHRATHVEVIPNFTRIRSIVRPEERKEQKRCVFVGRLCPEKDPLRLLALWSKVKKDNPDWTMDIYGEGEMGQEVREAVVNMGQNHSVRVHGFTDNVAKVYAESDILLLTSYTEGLPMVLIEAMRCGLPVVSTDCPHGPAEIINNGENGFLIPQDDDAAYIRAVSTLMRDASLRQRMGRCAMESSKRYSMPEIINRWKDFFRRLIKNTSQQT